MKYRTWAAVGLIAAATPGAALAQNLGQVLQNAVNNWQDDNNTGNFAQAQRATPDAGFVFEAARRTMTEIREETMAKKNAERHEIRDLAERLVRNDQRVYDRLAEIAQREGFALPSRPNDDQRDELARLSDMSGRRFDREFAETAVRNHERTLRQYEQEAHDGRDHDIREYAEHSISDLREHLELARHVQPDLDHDRDQGPAGP